jgi:hypothetical protein
MTTRVSENPHKFPLETPTIRRVKARGLPAQASVPAGRVLSRGAWRCKTSGLVLDQAFAAFFECAAAGIAIRRNAGGRQDSGAHQQYERHPHSHSFHFYLHSWRLL